METKSEHSRQPDPLLRSAGNNKEHNFIYFKQTFIYVLASQNNWVIPLHDVKNSSRINLEHLLETKTQTSLLS